MNDIDQSISKPWKPTHFAGQLGVAAVVFAGTWLLHRLISERSIQLLILSWVIAVFACGIAMRSSRAERYWWTRPAWMLAGSAVCLLAGLLTLRS